MLCLCQPRTPTIVSVLLVDTCLPASACVPPTTCIPLNYIVCLPLTPSLLDLPQPVCIPVLYAYFFLLPFPPSTGVTLPFTARHSHGFPVPWGGCLVRSSSVLVLILPTTLTFFYRHLAAVITSRCASAPACNNELHTDRAGRL